MIPRLNENVFDSIDTEEKAYWLGFLFADGYISSAPITAGSDNNHRIEICLALIDTGHLFKFNSFMCSKEQKVKVYNYKDVKGKDKQHAKWFISNKHLWETLNSHGCTPKKSLTLKFPNIDIFKSKDLIRHFIRGYVDGDGSISHNKNRLYLSILGTENFLKGIQKYFTKRGSNYRKKCYDKKIRGALRRLSVEAACYFCSYAA